MIAGLGMDIVSVSRIKLNLSPAFYAKVYTDAEVEMLKKRANIAETAAGNWTAKEAFLKALGRGMKDASLKEIEVLRNERGAPYINLYGRAKELYEEKDFTGIHVTITNTREVAASTVILESEKPLD